MQFYTNLSSEAKKQYSSAGSASVSSMFNNIEKKTARPSPYKMQQI